MKTTDGDLIKVEAGDTIKCAYNFVFILSILNSLNIEKTATTNQTTAKQWTRGFKKLVNTRQNKLTFSGNYTEFCMPFKLF